MFRRIFGIGLLIFLLMGVFGGFNNRSRAAYYEGYSDGLQAQAAESTEEGAEAVPPAVPYRDGHGRGGFLGWAALGVMGFFAIFFKIGFFFLLAMIFLRLIFGRRGRHRGGPWGRHNKHSHRGSGHEKSPKWMHDSDDDEPVMTV